MRGITNHEFSWRALSQLWTVVTTGFWIKWPRWKKKQDTGTNTVECTDPCAEKRAAPRFPLQQSVTVRLTSGGHYEFNGVSRDISATGIYVLIDTDVIEVGSNVEIMLNLPSTKQPIPIRVQGRVVRVEKPSRQGIAIAFDTLVIAPNALVPDLRRAPAESDLRTSNNFEAEQAIRTSPRSARQQEAAE